MTTLAKAKRKMTHSVNFQEQQRENDKQLRKAGREIDREKRKLELEEKKLVSEKYNF